MFEFYEEHIGKYKGNIWKLYLFKLFMNLYLIGPVFLVFYTDWAGLSFKYMMLAQAWYMFWIFLLEIPSGIFADYFGRKKTLIIATIANIFAILVYTYIPNFCLFLVAEFLWAIAFVLISGTDDALGYDSLEQIGRTYKSKKMFGRFESFAMLGIMIASPIGGFIASQLGPRFTMLFLIVPYFCGLLIVLTLKEVPVNKPLDWKYYLHNFKYELKMFKQNKVLIALAMDLILISTFIYGMWWLYQKILLNLGASVFLLGLVIPIFVILQIIIMNSFDFFENLFGSKKSFLVLSGLIVGLMYVLAAFTTNLTVMIIIIVVGCAFGFGRRPLLINYMNKHIPSTKRATLLSFVSMAEGFLLIFVNPLLGFFAEFSLYYLLLALGILSIFFTLFSGVKEDCLIE